MTFSTKTLFTAAALACTALSTPAFAQSAAQVMDEGLGRSEIMTTAHELMDGIGPRLTNSDNYRKAEEWAMAKMRGYGLVNVRAEPFDFGRGWNLQSWSATMVSPRRVQMTAIPVAWTPGTQGTLRGEVVLAPIASPGDFAQYAGKLAGKVVMISKPTASSEPDKGAFRRLTDEDIHKADEYRAPDYKPNAPNARLKRIQWPKQVDDFLKKEGAIAVIKESYRDAMLVHGEGYSYRPDATPAMPTFEVAAEDYRRLARLGKTGPAPVVELNSSVRWNDSTMNADNILGEIPGRDPKAGYVMAGAHFDSWVAGDGAADNGAGSVVVLEAARILKAIGARPKRAIRFALWAGEEQGLLGSRAYIEKHLVSRPIDPKLSGIEAYYAWTDAWPITKKPGYDELKAYFNLDNGSGKVRGIYAEQNVAAQPLLAKWMEPYNALGARNVVIAKTGGTDHVYMQAVGIQGFQFVQDPLDYGSRVHHSSIDTYDHLRADDLRQAATVMAGMLLAAANSDEVLPRPPLPTQPKPLSPFDF